MERVEVEVDQGDAALGAGRPQQAGQLTDGGGLVGQPGEGIDEGDALQPLLDLVLLADVLDGADGDERRTAITQGGAPPLQHHLQQAIDEEQAMFDPVRPARAERRLEGGIDQGAVLGMHRLEKVGIGGGLKLPAHMGEPLGLLEKGPQPAAFPQGGVQFGAVAVAHQGHQPAAEVEHLIAHGLRVRKCSRA